MNYFIGVDLGTTSTKAVLFEENGEIKASENIYYKLHRDNLGMAEQEPEEIFQAFLTAIHSLSKQITDDDKLLVVSFSSAMHSLIAFDKDWQPLTRVITWADTRAVKYTEKLKKEGIGKEIYLKTGTPIHPMAPLSKLLWLKNEHSEVFEKAEHYLGVKEYVFHRLFGSNKMDLSLATGTSLFNIFQLDWDEQALEVASVRREQLPIVVEPYEIEKGMKKHYAAQMNIPIDTPFVYGAADGALSNLGVNAVAPGVAAITIGTSGAIRVVSKQPLVDKKARTFTYALDKEHWVIGGSVNNGGDVFRWLKDGLFEEETFNSLATIAGGVEAGSDGLLFLPYLNGERAPLWDANARGSFFGLTYAHTREQMIRAVLEGITFNLYAVAQSLEEVVGKITTIQATGGFTRSEVWTQMMADIFEQTITMPESYESGALAAMTMGKKAIGLIDDLSEISQMIGAVKTKYPQQENQEIYRELSALFNKLSWKLTDEYRVISDIQRKYTNK